MPGTLNLDALHLEHGAHDGPTQGMCVMEAVAYAAGLPHSDQPACVSPLLRSFAIRLNDALDDERRQALKPTIFRVIGTAGDGKDDARSALARRQLMTVWLPEWLELAGLTDLADKARAGADLTGYELRESVRQIRDLTWKARIEARDALAEKIKARLIEKLGEQTVADADAVAVAAADAVAAAAAAADADAAADAVAAADADAVAAADAVAVAVADAAGKPADWYAHPNGGYYKVRRAVMDAVRKQIESSPKFEQIRALRDKQFGEALDLYDRMIDPAEDAA